MKKFSALCGSRGL